MYYKQEVTKNNIIFNQMQFERVLNSINQCILNGILQEKLYNIVNKTVLSALRKKTTKHF